MCVCVCVRVCLRVRVVLSRGGEGARERVQRENVRARKKREREVGERARTRAGERESQRARTRVRERERERDPWRREDTALQHLAGQSPALVQLLTCEGGCGWVWGGACERGRTVGGAPMSEFGWWGQNPTFFGQFLAVYAPGARGYGMCGVSRVHVCMYAWMHAFTHVHVYVCMHASMYVCVETELRCMHALLGCGMCAARSRA